MSTRQELYILVEAHCFPLGKMGNDERERKLTGDQEAAAVVLQLKTIGVSVRRAALGSRSGEYSARRERQLRPRGIPRHNGK